MTNRGFDVLIKDHFYPQNLDDLFLLKHQPNDFMVTEQLSSSVLPHKEKRRYLYLKLQKQGFTTFEAIKKIAAHLSINPKTITYAGLKDEDGIAEQSIAIPAAISGDDFTAFNDCTWGAAQKLHLTPFGYGDKPLVIGELDGNRFHIRARRLPRNLVKNLITTLEQQDGQFPVSVINYYDTQRFGIPGHPKHTHLIGRALDEADYDNALRLLKTSGTPESVEARTFSGPTRDFFAGLDPRITAFYHSAHSSYRWNRRVMDRLNGLVPPEELLHYQKHNIDFSVPKDSHYLNRLALAMPTSPYRRYSVREKGHSYKTIQRPTILQTNFKIHQIRPDDIFTGTMAVDFSFFLPAGVYATNFLTQFFLSLLSPSHDT